MAFNTLLPDGLMLLDLEHDSPVVLVSKVSSLELGPVVPIMMSALLGVDMLKLDVIVLSLEVLNDLGLDELEVAFNVTGDFDLLEGLV